MNRPARKTDIWILPQGTLTLVRPLTQRASEWIGQNLQEHSQWFGPALLIEHHYVAKLLNGMIADGLHVTQ
jgi:di/tricarboxylate transporter